MSVKLNVTTILLPGEMKQCLNSP